MKIISIIPARSGSKSIIDKNVRILGDKPLLAWTIGSSLECKSIMRTIVSTDSEEYANIARQFGAEVPFLRPKELSQDLSTDLDVIRHFIDWLDCVNDESTLIVHLRPTTPFRDVAVLDTAINNFLVKQDNFTSLRSVEEMSESAFKTFRIENELLLPLIDQIDIKNSNLPRQLFPKTYKANGYIDIIKKNYVKTSNSLHGDKILPFLTTKALEIDNQEDFENAKKYNLILENKP